MKVFLDTSVFLAAFWGITFSTVERETGQGGDAQNGILRGPYIG